MIYIPMAWVKEVGNQVARGVNYGVSNFNAPNYLYYWVIPFVLTTLIVAMLSYWALSKVKTMQECNDEVDEEGNTTKKCKDFKFPLWLKIIIGVVITSIAAGTVSSVVYKMAVYAHNPKMAAGIETMGYVRNAWNTD